MSVGDLDIDIDISRLMTVMAYQRSGTNMLGKAISSHPDIHYTNELFHKDNCGRPRTMGDVAQAIRQFDDPTAKVLCLDTKYNQITPPLEKLLRKIRVIHLVRRNDLEHWFSFQFLKARRHDPKVKRAVQQGKPWTLPFDQKSFDRFCAKKRRYQERFSDLGEQSLAYLFLTYEDLTNNTHINALPDWASQVICNLAGVETRPLIVSTHKGAPTDITSYLEGRGDA